jgi:hypothetical protein
MAEFRYYDTKVDFTKINGGKRYENGDGVNAETINTAVESSAFAQALAINQPNTEEAGLVGTPTVSIEKTEDGSPRLVFSHLGGKDHSAEIHRLNGYVSSNTKRIENLEQKRYPSGETEDAQTEYIKIVPKTALKYAEVKKIGGMTYVENDEMVDSKVTEIVTIGKNNVNVNAIGYWDNGAGGYFNQVGNTIEIQLPSDSAGLAPPKTLSDICPYLIVGETYRVMLKSNTTQNSIYLLDADVSLWDGRTLSITSKMLSSRMVFYGDKSGDKIIYYDFMITHGEDAYDYEPYEETHYPISGSVQSLDGYGLGVDNTCYNYIDYTRKVFVQRVKKFVFDGTENWQSYDVSGRTRYRCAFPDDYSSRNTIINKGFLEDIHFSIPLDGTISFDSDAVARIAGSHSIDEFSLTLRGWHSEGKPLTLLYVLAKEQETDISYLISTDNFIKVDGNGSVVMQNEGKKAVPSTIEYQLS